MTIKTWRLVLTPLNGSAPVRELDVEATNWMGALRASRKLLGEDGGVPAGASCGVAPDGTVTILDSASRRKFVLKPNAGEASAPNAAPSQARQALPRPPTPASAMSAVIASSPPAEPVQAAAPAPVVQPTASAAVAEAPVAKKMKFQTVAYTPGMALPEMPVAKPQPAAVPPTAATAPVVQAAAHAPAAPAAAVAAPVAATVAESPAAKKKKFQTVAFTKEAAEDFAKARDAIVVGSPAAKPNEAVPAAAPVIAPAKASPSSSPQAGDANASTSSPAPRYELELLMTRDEQPSPGNPLTYRERAYLIPVGMRVMDAEAALRFALVDLQQQIASTPRGKFVNLAAFDHRWTDAPERPPLIVLEWRDWRGDPIVDYPAAVRAESLPPADPQELDERIAAVFESLHELAHKRSAAEGLDFIVSVIQQSVPVAAVTACLYDINTDELRIVAVTGVGAQARQGKAIPRNVGLIGQAARVEHTVVVPDVRAQPAYSADTDSRPGLEPTNMLLRAIVHDGHLLGVLQLIDRQAAAFSAADVHVVNYAADRLADFLRDARGRVQR